jgi:hypothetical protein
VVSADPVGGNSFRSSRCLSLPLHREEVVSAAHTPAPSERIHLERYIRSVEHMGHRSAFHRGAHQNFLTRPSPSCPEASTQAIEASPEWTDTHRQTRVPRSSHNQTFCILYAPCCNDGLPVAPSSFGDSIVSSHHCQAGTPVKSRWRIAAVHPLVAPSSTAKHRLKEGIRSRSIQPLHPDGAATLFGRPAALGTDARQVNGARALVSDPRHDGGRSPRG